MWKEFVKIVKTGVFFSAFLNFDQILFVILGGDKIFPNSQTQSLVILVSGGSKCFISAQEIKQFEKYNSLGVGKTE